MYQRFWGVLVMLSLLVTFGCRDKAVNENRKIISKEVSLANDTTYINRILALDTLTREERGQSLSQLRKELINSNNQTDESYLDYVTGLYLSSENNKDSALVYFKKCSPALKESSLHLLKQISIDNILLEKEALAAPEFLIRLHKEADSLEKVNKQVIYQLYELIAKAYYFNRDLDKSLQFTELYYKNNPFKEEQKVKKHFYDISFLLASQLQQGEKATFYLEELRKIVDAEGDELAKVRFYDQEANLYGIINQPQKALASSKKHYYYCKKLNALQDNTLNNLATSFVVNKQIDSAIYYYKYGIFVNDSLQSPYSKHVLYGGLSNAYRLKGDYKNAIAALDSSFTILTRKNDQINASKLEEIKAKYKSDEKDLEIKVLKANNELQQKIVRQQWWLLGAVFVIGVGVVYYFTILHKQRLLKVKNRELEQINKSMELEQRLLQLQLNPHFIYNAIANLQGFIATDRKQEANKYLLSFSHLMRSILELNRSKLVSLEEELKAIEHYVQLQQMRFNQGFDYCVEVDDIEIEEIAIPPMLLQPFIENAIEHGFCGIDYQGKIKVVVQEIGEQLIIEIIDNGKGLQQLPQPKTDKKSLSSTITQERLDVLFNKEKKRASFEVSNRTEETGVIVKFCLPIEVI
jgi:chemotaxis protein histidine kinase CheA